MTRTLKDTARIALDCLDLTSLNDGDTEAQVDTLCERAASPHGAPAALCVWPRLARHARLQAPAAVRIAAVVHAVAATLDGEAQGAVGIAAAA